MHIWGEGGTEKGKEKKRQCKFVVKLQDLSLRHIYIKLYLKTIGTIYVLNYSIQISLSLLSLTPSFSFSPSPSLSLPHPICAYLFNKVILCFKDKPLW
jgi:hypothetical protein